MKTNEQPEILSVGDAEESLKRAIEEVEAVNRFLKTQRFGVGDIINDLKSGKARMVFAWKALSDLEKSNGGECIEGRRDKGIVGES